MQLLHPQKSAKGMIFLAPNMPYPDGDIFSLTSSLNLWNVLCHLIFRLFLRYEAVIVLGAEKGKEAFHS